MNELIDLFFCERLSDERRHRILRYCVKSCGDERRRMVRLLRANIEALSSVEDMAVHIERASDILYFLASDVDLGLPAMAECADSVFNLYARILSHFLERWRVEQEAALRLVTLSLLLFVRYARTEVTPKVEGTLGVVARLVRRLMTRGDLPINVVLDCGVMAFEIDSRLCRHRRRFASSLWLLKKWQNGEESVIFVALCYGALTVTSPRFFSKMLRHEENASRYEQTISVSALLRSASSRKNDGRYLLAVLKFFEIFSRKIRFVDVDAILGSHFSQHFVNFLWQHCDHFVDAVRALSRQCLKNALSQSDPTVTLRVQEILMNTDDADERLCYAIVNGSSEKLLNEDRLSHHCFHLVSRRLMRTESSAPCSWTTKAYVTLMTDAYRGEFDSWFERWIRPIWESSVQQTLAFRRDVIVAAITVWPQSLEILIDTATKEQLSLILDCLLLIEDKEIRCKRMNSIDPRNLVGVASSNPLAVITFISERKDPTSCNESLRASVDAIFCCDCDYQRRMFVLKFKKIAVDEDIATWIQQRCFSNLFAGASFDRRYFALLLLATLSQPLKNCNSDHLSTLFACLGDSYQENQNLAVQLLKPIAGNLCNGDQLGPIFSFLIKALFEASVSEHDTCAFVSQLLCYLPACEFDLRVLWEYARPFGLNPDLLAVKENGPDSVHVYLSFLLEIVKSRLKECDTIPLYGVLRVIRHIVEHTRSGLYECELFAELAKTCVECNLQVLPIVSQSSPEGYLPPNELTELPDETDESLLYVNSQKALLRGWRTLKEASLLLKHLLVVQQFDQHLMKFIGAHLKTLLFELKHKGAIEVVFLVASTFCYECSRSTSEYLSDIPRCWLQEIVESIISGNEGPICRWRRSAGIPFIVQAVLSTDSVQSDILCNKLAKQLLRIYIDEDTKEESKVHSANVLRVLFKNRNLAQKVDNHVEMTLQVAIDGVASSSWNVRNVSWLLLGSVVPRSFESNKCGRNAISFFRKFPSLIGFFCQKLRGCDRSQLKNQSSVFAVLQLLASFQPSNECEYADGIGDSVLKNLLPIVFECGASPIWKIRIIAVRAVRALVTRDSYVSLISGICANLKLPLEQNSLHGSLLQVEILLRLRWALTSDEKYYLRRTMTDLVADTNSMLNDDKNSALVKRQVCNLRTLICTKLTEWKLNDDEAFGSTTTAIAVHWPRTYLDDGTFIRSWIVHLVSHQLRATLNLEQMEKLLEHCLRCEPAITVDVLQIFLLPTSGYLEEENDSICLLRDHFLVLNTVDRNRIIGHVKRSQSICRLLNTFVRDRVTRKIYPLGGIRLLSYLADGEFFESLTVDEIESMCSLAGNDEEAISAIADYVRRASKFLVIHPPNEFLRIVRSICTLDWTTVAIHHHKKQIALYDEFLSRIRFSDNVSTILDIWSQKLQFATCEEPYSLDALLRHFYSDSLSLDEPGLCAVALVGWSLADIGIIWDRIRSQGAQSAFSENLPVLFENHVLLSRICTKLLRELLHSHPQLPHSVLDRQLTLWLCEHCHISPAESIFKLVDVVSFFSEMRANLVTSFGESLAAFLYRGTVFKRFVIDNISLVISAFENVL